MQLLKTAVFRRLCGSSQSKLILAQRIVPGILFADLTLADLPHDTDFPYVIRIIDDLRVIRPYHILIRNCLYTENPYTAHKNDNRKTYASGGPWQNQHLYCPTDGASLFWKRRPMKASLSNVTRLPNTHRGCAEGSPESLTGRTGSIHRIIQNTEWCLPRKREFSKDWIRLFGDSSLNQSWVYTQSWVSSTLGIGCDHAT